MTVIPIYIFDSAKSELAEKLQQENDRLGFEKNKIEELQRESRYSLVDFFFNERQLTGFWLDIDRDDDTKTKDIIVYIGGVSFRTPFSQEKHMQLIELLNLNL